MKAKKQAKIFSRHRVALEQVVPLATPFSVEIDICSVCNFDCNFCFHADKKGIAESHVKFGRMDMALFQKVITDLKAFPDKIKKVRLFEFGEPLLHPDLPRMIREIWKTGVAEYVEITTNGVLLNEALNLELVAAGLSRINISVNGVTPDKYRQICRHALDMPRFLANLAHLYENRGNCHIYIKLADDGTLTQAEEEQFYRLFGDVCDEIFIERLSPIWRDTDVNIATHEPQNGPYGQKLEYKKVCPLIFTRLVINYDGVVVACCVDWKRAFTIGDVRKQSARDIWNGPILRALQKKHLKGARDTVAICKGCTALTSCTIDNVDAHAESILARYGS